MITLFLTMSLVTGAPPATADAPAPAELLIVSSRAGAEVSVDGTVVGVTPLDLLRLPPGRHRVVIRLPGTEPYVETVDLVSGQQARIEARLLPQAILPPLAIGEPGIETSRTGHTPIITRWWFWGVVAVLGAAIVITGAHFSSGNDFVPTGEISPTDTNDWDRL